MVAGQLAPPELDAQAPALSADVKTMKNSSVTETETEGGSGLTRGKLFLRAADSVQEARRTFATKAAKQKRRTTLKVSTRLPSKGKQQTHVNLNAI